MGNDATFIWYLKSCGIDIEAAQQQYLAMLKNKPEYIVHFYAKLYPDEFIAWKAKNRIIGYETT